MKRKVGEVTSSYAERRWSAMGQQLVKRYNDDENNKKIALNLFDDTKGVCFIRIFTSNRIFTEKIVFQ